MGQGKVAEVAEIWTWVTKGKDADATEFF